MDGIGDGSIFISIVLMKIRIKHFIMVSWKQIVRLPIRRLHSREPRLTIIVVREKRQGFTTGSIWMDDIFSLINGRNYLSFQPNMHHHEMASGHHHWYVCSHARPTYCNVCREALSGVTSHGLSCEGKGLRRLTHFKLKNLRINLLKFLSAKGALILGRKVPFTLSS